MEFSGGASTDDMDVYNYCERRAGEGPGKGIVPSVELCATDGRTNYDHNHNPFVDYYVIMRQGTFDKNNSKLSGITI